LEFAPLVAPPAPARSDSVASGTRTTADPVAAATNVPAAPAGQRLVRSAAGLAGLLRAAGAPLADALPLQAASPPLVESAAEPAPPAPPPAPAPDIGELLRALTEELEFEYLRTYGSLE